MPASIKSGSLNQNDLSTHLTAHLYVCPRCNQIRQHHCCLSICGIHMTKAYYATYVSCHAWSNTLPQKEQKKHAIQEEISARIKRTIALPLHAVYLAPLRTHTLETNIRACKDSTDTLPWNLLQDSPESSTSVPNPTLFHWERWSQNPQLIAQGFPQTALDQLYDLHPNILPQDWNNIRLEHLLVICHVKFTC